MQRIGVYALLLALALGFAGCSKETQRDASEAVDQTGEALRGAAEDAANVTEGAVKGASEAVGENRAEPERELPE